MTVSFLVTYYNQKEYVRRSLDGIAALHLSCPFEILIGDDCSDDGTQEEIRNYMGLHPELPFTLYVMSRDPEKREKSIIRASANRLNLLRHAKGKYFLSLDGDDCYCDCEFVQESVARLESNPDLIGCAYGILMCTESEKNINTLPIKEAAVLENDDYLVKNFWCHSGAIVFRNIFDAEKINTVAATNFFDDDVMTIYMLQFGRLYYTPKPVYCYFCKNNGSLMNSFEKTELHFLQTMEYETLTKLVPCYRNQIRVWQWAAIQYTWKHRNRLGSLSVHDMETYQNWNMKLGNRWCLRMLGWKTDPVPVKIQTILLYWILVIQRYAGNFRYALRNRVKRILP